MTAAEAPAATARICSAPRVPQWGIATKLAASAPAIAPTVFAAYTLPLERPVSVSAEAAAARANGKLAPQRMAAGRMTSMHRCTWRTWMTRIGVRRRGDVNGTTSAIISPA